MIFLYNLLFYQPLLNALVFLYETIAFRDLGLAIILLTLGIRILLYPIFQKTIKHQVVMQELQPALKKIQEDHRHNREAQSRAMMALYRERGVNPFSGIFLLLLQLPVLIALYQIFLRGLTPETLGELYSFLDPPLEIHNTLFGLINLGERSILLVGLAAFAQYLQASLGVRKRLEGEKETPAQAMSRRMALLAPGITLVVLLYLPAAVGLYWFITSLASLLQQHLVQRNQRERLHGSVDNHHQKPA